MAYPQAPWILNGYALLTGHSIEIQRVRHLIPKELEIITVLPGKTLGGVYLSYYGQGSELEYSELIVVPAVVGYQGKVGGWVSHIYVDNPESVAGGREIWGLPKEIAEFTWEKGEQITVRQGERTLCTLNYQKPLFAWPQWFGASSFSAKNTNLLCFSAEMESRLGLVGSKLEVPAESPFAEIGLGQPFLTIRAEQMSLRVRAPEVVGQREVEYTYSEVG
ncbi:MULTISPECIES: acetoacetate decarboxylase family protein [Nostocales]|uniref:Acetoacetate decarboxylase n=3 Tax=Nostocales TaxID=1161 RepID=A0A0C1R1I5_9CYAN|nr:acetoacetate decarboxylase family protein [Tolypothrix bouteillei]KAF3884580.1 acetoacetate decarboxylase family protein [Tolypothrix bouteillei VB521301]